MGGREMNDPILDGERPGGLIMGAIGYAKKLKTLQIAIADASRDELVDAIVEARLTRHGRGDLERLLQDLAERVRG